MLFGRTAQRIAALSTAITVGAATLLAGAGEAEAAGPVVGTAKGAVGGGLLGAETVTITLAIIGVQKGWPYFVFGGVGAVGGAIGGYFVETVAPAEAPLYMLAGGMALVIPALVASLNATAYKPPEGVGDDPTNNEPVDEPPAPDGTTTRKIISGVRGKSQKALGATPHVPISIFDVHQGRVALGVPAVEVRTLYTEQERAMYGVELGHEVRIPVLRAIF